MMYPGTSPGMWGYGEGMGWMMGLHGLFSLAILVLVALGIVALVRALWRAPGHVQHTLPTDGGARRPDALNTLEVRYAKGEIDRDEFLRKKQDLAV